MSAAPKVDTSSWRLPQRKSANPTGIPSDDAYARVGLGMIPKEAARAAAPSTGPVAEGAPVVPAPRGVDTSTWRLPQPTPKPAADRDLMEHQRTLAALLPEGEKRFGLGIPQRQLPSQEVVPRQVEAREDEVSYQRPGADAVSPISEDLRRLITRSPAMPTPINDSHAVRRPSGQGLLDETASGGQAFVDQLLRDSQWDLRRPTYRSEAAPPVHKPAWSGSEPSYVDSAAQMKAAKDAKDAEAKAAKDAEKAKKKADEGVESLDDIVERRIQEQNRRVKAKHGNPAGHGAPIRLKKQSAQSKAYNRTPAAKKAKKAYDRSPEGRSTRRKAARFRREDEEVIEGIGSALRKLGAKIQGAGDKIVSKSKPSAKASIQKLKTAVKGFGSKKADDAPKPKKPKARPSKG